MNRKYDKTVTTLKTVVHDTAVLDARKILIKTPNDTGNSRTNILDYIDSFQNPSTSYTEYDTHTFAYGVENSSADTSSFRLGFNHTPNGIIKKVSTYARGNGGNSLDCYTNGCYLLIEKYNKTSGEVVGSYLSTNKVIVQKTSSSAPILNTWEFDGFESCNEDEVLKFIPTPGTTQIADYYLGILVDSKHTHDDCAVGGDTFVNGVNTTPLGAGNKWATFVKFEGEFTTDAGITSINEHLVDDNKHLNHCEKSVLETLYTTSTGELWNNNINSVTLNSATVKGFILSRPYISNCIFNEIRWTTTGTASNVCYIKLTLKDIRGHSVGSYFSNNTEDFSAAGLKSYRFDNDIVIDDKIGSIVCEISLDKTSVITTENKQIRITTLGSDNNTTDGSEVANNNYIANVIFWGKKPSSILSSHIGDNTHLTDSQKSSINDYDTKKNTFAIKSDVDATYAKQMTLFGGEYRTASGNDNTLSWDACRLPAAYVPHLQPIHSISLTPLNDNPDTPVYLGAIALNANETSREILKLSSNALTWVNGLEISWDFEDGFIIPAGYHLELYLIANKDDFTTSPPNTTVLMQSSLNGSLGVGKIRPVGTAWGGPRLLDCIMTTHGHVNDNTHLSSEDRELLDNLASGYIENLYTNSVNILEEGETISTPTPVTVTIDEITLDADVVTQNRMARAILVMEDDETVQWLSSDKTIVTLSKSQLKQVLKAALSNEINNWIGV